MLKIAAIFMLLLGCEAKLTTKSVLSLPANLPDTFVLKVDGLFLSTTQLTVRWMEDGVTIPGLSFSGGLSPSPACTDLTQAFTKVSQGSWTFKSVDEETYYICLEVTLNDTALPVENNALKVVIDRTPPTISVGADLHALSTVELTGTGSEDIVSWAWEKVSGPGDILFDRSSGAATKVAARGALSCQPLLPWYILVYTRRGACVALMSSWGF